MFYSSNIVVMFSTPHSIVVVLVAVVLGVAVEV